VSFVDGVHASPADGLGSASRSAESSRAWSRLSGTPAHRCSPDGTARPFFLPGAPLSWWRSEHPRCRGTMFSRCQSSSARELRRGSRGREPDEGSALWLRLAGPVRPNEFSARPARPPTSTTGPKWTSTRPTADLGSHSAISSMSMSAPAGDASRLAFAAATSSSIRPACRPYLSNIVSELRTEFLTLISSENRTVPPSAG
jgi:hypothetical protein